MDGEAETSGQQRVLVSPPRYSTTAKSGLLSPNLSKKPDRLHQNYDHNITGINKLSPNKILSPNKKTVLNTRGTGRAEGTQRQLYVFMALLRVSTLKLLAVKLEVVP